MHFQQDETGVFRFRPWRDRAELVHGFTTRATGNFRELRSLGFLGSVLGLDGMRLSSLEQVHSNELVVERGAETADRPSGDGFLTNVPGHLLSIRTADCFAILLADHDTAAIAAVHAGWRGTAGRIAFRAVDHPLGQALLASGGMPMHIAGHLERDSWRGRNEAQMIIEDAAKAV